MSGSSFSICVHIMTLLSQFEGEYVTSEFIASSITINPVMVRRELGKLKKQGLVESKLGKSGGVRLSRSPSDITLKDIFEAERDEGDRVLAMYKNVPHPNCPIGAHIQMYLSEIFSEIDRAVIDKLEQITLEQFHAKFS